MCPHHYQIINAPSVSLESVLYQIINAPSVSLESVLRVSEQVHFFSELFALFKGLVSIFFQQKQF